LFGSKPTQKQERGRANDNNPFFLVIFIVVSFFLHNFLFDVSQVATTTKSARLSDFLEENLVSRSAAVGRLRQRFIHRVSLAFSFDTFFLFLISLLPSRNLFRRRRWQRKCVVSIVD
jgi:hypothetical protein